MPHLVLQVFDGGQVVGVVMADHGLVHVPLSDLLFQLVVLLLQGAHLLQVGGQAVIEVLHGGHLVGPHVEVQAIRQAEAPGRGLHPVEAPVRGLHPAEAPRLHQFSSRGPGGDAGAASASAPIDAGGSLGVVSVREGHAGGSLVAVMERAGGCW